MRYCRHHSWLLSGFAALMLATAAQAQNPPQPLSLDLIGRAQLDPQQVSQIKAYAEYWANALKAETSSPAQVERARDELIRPLNQPNAARVVSPIFRMEYSNVVVPAMDKAMKGKDIHRAVNAGLVLSQLGSDKAANMLLLNADIQNQPTWQVRSAAASSAELLLQLGTLDARKVVETAGKLRDAVGREDNGLSMRRLLEAMHSADLAVRESADQSKVRAAIGDAIAVAAERVISKEEPSVAHIEAVASALAELRSRFATSYSDQDKANLGIKLGPRLFNLLHYANGLWDKRDKSPLGTALGVVVANAEGLLLFIDPTVKPTNRPTPTSDMRNAWEAGDQGKYQAGLKGWEAVITQPPYKQ